jgi:hypothetical protein
MAFRATGAILFPVSLARRALSALAVVSSLGAAGWCRADPPTYADVPRVSTSDVAFFRGLFQSSGSSALRIALIGDSQETLADGNDLGILLSEWGPGMSRADLNRDGAVDGTDLGMLLAAWGPVNP